MNSNLARQLMGLPPSTARCFQIAVFDRATLDTLHNSVAFLECLETECGNASGSGDCAARCMYAVLGFGTSCPGRAARANHGRSRPVAVVPEGMVYLHRRAAGLSTISSSSSRLSSSEHRKSILLAVYTSFPRVVLPILQGCSSDHMSETNNKEQTHFAGGWRLEASISCTAS